MATARKQRARGFNKFLDFIGLVESDDKDNEFEAEFESRPRGRNAGRSVVMEDEFEEEPRMARASSRNSERSAKRPSAGRFEETEERNTGRGRPEYSSSRNSRSSASRSSAYGKYGTDPGYGASSSQSYSSSSRYSDTSFGGTGGYYSGRDRGSAASHSGSYGTSSRWEDSDAFQSYSTSQPGSRSMPIGGQRHQTVIFKLHSVDECKEVILALIEQKSVLLNLDKLDSLQAQRALDTMCGATFAIGATLSKASDRTWLIAPNSVEVANSQGDDGYETGRYM